MASETKNVPDWLLERFAVGELDAARTADVQRRLEADPAERARLDALRRSNAEILLQHPPRTVVPEIQRRAGRTTKRSTRALWTLAMPIAAAAALALVVGTKPRGDLALDTGEGPEVTRTKGTSPVLRVYRQLEGNAEELLPGAKAKKGDLLQVAYAAMGFTHGVIFSIDGRGAVTLHFPSKPGESQKLLAGGEVALTHAYELDDAPSFERFFVVGAKDAPIDIDAVLAGARDLAKDPGLAASGYLRLPDGLAQYSITLRKEQ